MPNPQPAPSHTAFFSPQTAFYQQQMPSMEVLSNNPLLLTAFKQGMKHVTDQNVLSTKVKTK